MRAAFLIGAAAVLVCGAVLILAPRADLLTTIEIAAPPGRVWAALTDTSDYPAWNPMIAGLKGDLRPGAVVGNIERYGKDRTIFWPTILTVRKDRELRWFGHLSGVPGLFDGEHYFLLRPTATGTLFTQGEHFRGALLWVFDVRRLVPGFEAMNVALAARAQNGR